MSSGADLFVVCKQCGSEVSPYITECPYCGHRLRRRAPKLPRENAPSRTRRGLTSRRPRLRPKFLRRSRSRRGVRRFPFGERARVGSAPYATIMLVAGSCAVWVAWHASAGLYAKLTIDGQLHGDWWRLFTSPFAYENGLYEFVTLVAIGIFGWLLERRHGLAVVLALFFGSSAAGGLVALAASADAVVSGANGAALALLAAWAVPDLLAARSGSDYEGDLLGTGAIAAVLLAMPFARPEASWLAGLTGGAIGLVFGLGLRGMGAAES